MFLHADSDRPGPLAIPQTSHSWMAWQLAAHWGNRRFARPSPRADVLAAVLLHDSGWTDFDPSPGIGEDGRPLTFDQMPVAAHLAIWEAGIVRGALHSRYVALLIASHFDRLAARKRDGDDHALEAVRSWRRRLADRKELWRSQLATDPRYERFLSGSRWEANQGLVAACDAVSVYLCAGRSSAFTVPAAGRDLAPGEITFEPIRGRLWKVRPWPLQGRRLDIHCEGRRLENGTFRSDSELREALLRAPTERLSFTLVSPSRSAGG